jgi:anti-anti-sigma factor
MTDVAATVELHEDGRGATLHGELDLATYEALSTTLAPLFELDGDLRLDLTDVAFVDSSAIRLFVRLQESRGPGASVHLQGAQPHVGRVLEVSGVRDLGIEIEGADG